MSGRHGELDTLALAPLDDDPDRERHAGNTIVRIARRLEPDNVAEAARDVAEHLGLIDAPKVPLQRGEMGRLGRPKGKAS